MHIAVRCTQDAFSRSGWLWRVDAKGEPLKATSYMAVGFYVAKYVNKKSDMDLAAKGLGAKEWNNSLKTKLSLLPKKLFRIRMSRNFGMKMLTMTNLSTECLIQDRKSGSAGMPRPISYAVFCLKKKTCVAAVVHQWIRELRDPATHTR